MPSVLSATTSLLGTVHPDGNLPRLGLSVSFLGNLPAGLDICSLPIQIAISFPSELGAYTYPALQLLPEPVDVSNGDVKISDNDKCTICNGIAGTPPPFAPLPSFFCTSVQASWITLYTEIAAWMKEYVNNRELKTWEWA
ncbi:hypothetical protein C8Q74DRAFT_1213083 [Fomes fomentarius]|nr:hypothetical protein C8Q74DRAFT_1213083 [Fomes fomentarius]